MQRGQRVKAFDVAVALAGAVVPHTLGLREVPVTQITGSVGRASELRPDFQPRRRFRGAARRHRLQSVETAMRRGDLPPVDLYRLGAEYFVLDGHHRIAAARKIGQLYVDAHVTDFLPADRAGHGLEDRLAFELRTRLQLIELSDPVHYRRLLNQVEEHRWAMSQRLARPVELPEAAADWHERVYTPVVGHIEAAGLQEQLAGRTTADLYAYVSDHKWYVSQASGRDVGFAWAVSDFVHLCPPRIGRSVRTLLHDILCAVLVSLPTDVEGGPSLSL